MPLEAVALRFERHLPRPRPTLPGKAPGVVGVREGARGKLYTLQCQECYTTEEPEHLILMTIHFHARSRDGENPRLCRSCRVTAYPECICDACREDRKREFT